MHRSDFFLATSLPLILVAHLIPHRCSQYQLPQGREVGNNWIHSIVKSLRGNLCFLPFRECSEGLEDPRLDNSGDSAGYGDSRAGTVMIRLTKEEKNRTSGRNDTSNRAA